MTMPEHTITVEASGIGRIPDDDVLITALEHVEAWPGILGPALSADLERGVVTLTATMDTDAIGLAENRVRSVFGEALVIAGLVDGWQPAGAGQAVLSFVN